MICAILAGTKTQTRRIIKPKPAKWIIGFRKPGIPYKITNKKPSENGAIWQEDNGACYEPIRCPYGQEGDRLWVRETFYAYGRWEYITTQKKGDDHDGWHFIDKTLAAGLGYMYESNPPKVLKSGRNGIGWYKRPSLFMPREASRILLEVTGICVELLNDISESNAIAEGVKTNAENGIDDCNGEWWNYEAVDFDDFPCASAKESYKTLWQSINGPGSWAQNPAVWVVEFKVL